jgi:hypothetical protein
MRSKTIPFLTPDPVRAFRKPGRVWSIEATRGMPDITVWVLCFGTAHPHLADQSTLVLSFPLQYGFDQDLRFAKGFHFPHGLVVGISANKYDLRLPDALSPGIELRIDYETDAEIAHAEAIRARLERRPDDPHSVAVALPDFLRSGHLGPIHLGMPRAMLIETIGNPNNWSSAESAPGQPAILVYGNIEFYFGYQHDDLTCILSDNFDVLAGGEALRFDPWILRKGTPLHEVEEQLTAHEIGLQQVSRAHFPTETLNLTTVSGVELGFELQSDMGEDFGLAVVSLSAQRET